MLIKSLPKDVKRILTVSGTILQFSSGTTICTAVGLPGLMVALSIIAIGKQSYSTAEGVLTTL
jgi:hypothetical protein